MKILSAVMAWLAVGVAGSALPTHLSAQNTPVVPVSLPGVLAEAREPQVAVSGKGKVFVAYGVKNALYCSVSDDAGRRYALPVKVAEAGVLSLGMRRGPRIAVTDKSVVITAVYGEQGKGRDGDLLAWRSPDGGKTWQGPSKVSDVAGAAREGLHAMTASSGGAVACAWLDLRSKGTRIYAAVSQDGGATWSGNRLVYQSPDGSVCECCHPSVSYDAQGCLYVMWRNSLGGARDMYLSRSDDNGKTFAVARKMGTGTWPLNYCPMDGGAVAIDTDGSVKTFWQRSGKMFACTVGEEESLVGDGVQGWMAAGLLGRYYVWLERRGGRLRLQTPAQTAAILADAADDPVVASAPGGRGPLLVVWTSTQTSAPGILSVSLPQTKR